MFVHLLRCVCLVVVFGLFCSMPFDMLLLSVSYTFDLWFVVLLAVCGCFRLLRLGFGVLFMFWVGGWCFCLRASCFAVGVCWCVFGCFKGLSCVVCYVGAVVLFVLACPCVVVCVFGRCVWFVFFDAVCDVADVC